MIVFAGSEGLEKYVGTPPPPKPPPGTWLGEPLFGVSWKERDWIGSDDDGVLAVRAAATVRDVLSAEALADCNRRFCRTMGTRALCVVVSAIVWIVCVVGC